MWLLDITTDQNDKGYLTINGEEAGSYDIEANYGGNDQYQGSSARTIITVTDDVSDDTSTDDVQQTNSTATADTSKSSSGSNGSSDDVDDQTKYDLESGTHYDSVYGIRLDEDNKVVSSDNGQGIGLSREEWIQENVPEDLR